MNNQDMPVSPATIKERFAFAGRDSVTVDVEYSGETKREKAFWQVFSAMLSTGFSHHSPEELAAEAIEATNAGFKALENK